MYALNRAVHDSTSESEHKYICVSNPLLLQLDAVKRCLVANGAQQQIAGFIILLLARYISPLLTHCCWSPQCCCSPVSSQQPQMVAHQARLVVGKGSAIAGPQVLQMDTDQQRARLWDT